MSVYICVSLRNGFSQIANPFILSHEVWLCVCSGVQDLVAILQHMCVISKKDFEFFPLSELLEVLQEFRDNRENLLLSKEEMERLQLCLEHVQEQLEKTSAQNGAPSLRSSASLHQLDGGRPGASSSSSSHLQKLREERSKKM